jgi:hypothetical protein
VDRTELRLSIEGSSTRGCLVCPLHIGKSENYPRCRCPPESSQATQERNLAKTLQAQPVCGIEERFIISSPHYSRHSLRHRTHRLNRIHATKMPRERRQHDKQYHERDRASATARAHNDCSDAQNRHFLASRRMSSAHSVHFFISPLLTAASSVALAFGEDTRI